MNNKTTTKQIIVMRKTFTINGEKRKLRTGKYTSQSAHASLGAILGQMDYHADMKYLHGDENEGTKTLTLELKRGSAIHDWINNSFTKITLCVETEEELLAVYNKAKEAGLITCLITDKGNTEFGGVPTITCCSIGPAWSDELDPITGNLELF
jgi:PTH2 family peptidyl-tRNA hydrolase